MCTGMRHHHPSTSPGWTDRRTPENRTGQIRSPSPGWLWVHRGGNGGLWLPGDFQVFYHVKVTLKCFARAPGCAEQTHRAPSCLLRESCRSFSTALWEGTPPELAIYSACSTALCDVHNAVICCGDVDYLGPPLRGSEGSRLLPVPGRASGPSRGWDLAWALRCWTRRVLVLEASPAARRGIPRSALSSVLLLWLGNPPGKALFLHSSPAGRSGAREEPWRRSRGAGAVAREPRRRSRRWNVPRSCTGGLCSSGVSGGAFARSSGEPCPAPHGGSGSLRLPAGLTGTVPRSGVPGVPGPAAAAAPGL